MFRRKTSLAAPTTGTTSDMKYDRQIGIDNSIGHEAIIEGEKRALGSEPKDNSMDFKNCTFDGNKKGEEGNLCKLDMKICEEDEDLIENEAVSESLEPRLMQAEILIPKVHTPQGGNFARFFNVNETGSVMKQITV